MAAERPGEPEHNRLKLPVLVLSAIVYMALAVRYVVLNRWWAAALFVLFAGLALRALVVARSGRNPWWLRSPLDRRRD